MQGSDGWLYGTTFDGGTNYCGTVFKISTGGTLTNLYRLPTGWTAPTPLAGVVQGRDGYFYGTASAGGAYSNGTVFKISSTGIFTTLHSFRGGSDGAMPCGALLQASDGNIYGTTSGQNANGTLGSGTVFKISTNGLVTTVASCAALGAGHLPKPGWWRGATAVFMARCTVGRITQPHYLWRRFQYGSRLGISSVSIYSLTAWMARIPRRRWCKPVTAYFYGLANYGRPDD